MSLFTVMYSEGVANYLYYLKFLLGERLDK